MEKKWLLRMNMLLGSLATLLFVCAFFIALVGSDEIVIVEPASVKSELPKGAFEMPEGALDAIDKTLLELKFSPRSLQLPDLRKYLIYYGRNGRPDAQNDRTVLHFAISDNTLHPLIPGDRLYLQYDRQRSANPYGFSPNNAPTNLWIEASLNGYDVVVKVFMKNEAGDLIMEPASHAQFTAPEKEYMRGGGKTWEIDDMRVDGSLLARQKARWVGPDLFLERHGGDEYSAMIGKQRIEFALEEDPYSVFVGLDDSLVWSDGRWKVVKPSASTLNSPLMLIKKIEERLMGFELWDVGGKGKMVLNLLKLNDKWQPQQVQQLQKKFKFIGARKRLQYIFEVDGERIHLSPKDWLLFSDDTWSKLTTPKEIDDYVDYKTPGVLFVFDEVASIEGHPVLAGVMFNESRTEMQPIELPIQQLGNSNQQDEEGGQSMPKSGPAGMKSQSPATAPMNSQEHPANGSPVHIPSRSDDRLPERVIERALRK